MGAALLGCLLSPAALAMPAIIDRVPADARAVLAVTELERLDQRSAELFRAINVRDLPTLAEVLENMKLRAGLNLSGSAAAVVLPGPAVAPANDGADEDAPLKWLLLLPVSDGPALMAALGARQNEGVYAIEYAGEPLFGRLIDAGLAVLGPDAAAVAQFKAAPGNADHHRSALGHRGRLVADSADVVAFGPPHEFLGLLQVALAPLLAQTPALGGVDGAGLRDPRAGIAGRIMVLAGQEASGAIVGVKLGASGASMDLAVAFPDDTVMGRACRASIDESAPAFTRLAQEPFLFAGSIDTAHPGLREVLEELSPPMRSSGELARAERMVIEAAAQMSSAAVVVYTPPSLMMGVLTRTVLAWEAAEPTQASEAFAAWLQTMPAGEPDSFKTTFKAGAQRVAGLPVASWSLQPPPGSFPMGALFFGAGSGPEGLLATGNGAGYLTWGPDVELLKSVIEAGQAGANNPQAQTLANDADMLRAGAELPASRVMEWHINPRPLLNQFRAMLPEGTLPDEGESIGLLSGAVVMEQGSLQASVHAPSALLGVMVKAASSAGQPDEEAQEEPRRERRDRPGRPRPPGQRGQRPAGEPR